MHTAQRSSPTCHQRSPRIRLSGSLSRQKTQSQSLDNDRKDTFPRHPSLRSSVSAVSKQSHGTGKAGLQPYRPTVAPKPELGPGTKMLDTWTSTRTSRRPAPRFFRPCHPQNIPFAYRTVHVSTRKIPQAPAGAGRKKALVLSKLEEVS